MTVKQLRDLLSGIADDKLVMVDIIGGEGIIEAIPQCTVEASNLLAISAIKIK
ncbi:MAG: hypothetical protein KAS32_29445 [Candidatus Peribacteraceae bacterium]|nr:hypothetical protein [Candidatus Peribacteraceae bacterium]